MDAKPHRQDQIVKLNMGGCKPDIALQTIKDSNSEYFRVLLGSNFSQIKDSEGRIFIGCSEAVGQVMQHYMCHHALDERHTNETHHIAAKYFACDGLKELINQKTALETEWKWLHTKLNEREWLFKHEDGSISICPICHKSITYKVPITFPAFANILAHLIISHHAQIQNFSGDESKRRLFLRYKDGRGREIDESKFAAQIIRLRNIYNGGIEFSCIFCRYHEYFSVYDDKYQSAIRQHLIEHSAEILDINKDFVLFIYP